ncbi:MAG: hypothetical protein R2939_08875 [Kofleriaceae bacterium]
MNVADTELIGGILGDAGYRATTEAADADVVLINTAGAARRPRRRVVARPPSWPRSSDAGPAWCSASSAAWPSTSRRNWPSACPAST